MSLQIHSEAFGRAELDLAAGLGQQGFGTFFQPGQMASEAAAEARAKSCDLGRAVFLNTAP